MEILNKKQILDRRKEIEQELIDFLKEAKSDFTLEHIKEIIYDEKGRDDLTDVVAMFDTGEGDIELSDILELVTDAWNYFPHKAIGGISPAEKSLEYEQSKK